jgi:hypothetical protein
MRARILSIVLSTVLVVGSSIALAAPAQAATGSSATVFSLTNAHRANAGLKPLISDPALDRAAQAWAKYLASSCKFVHSTATWRASRVGSAGWSATGENIAAGYATPNAVMSGWMASSGHRANILNSRYTGVGIGFAKGTCYGSYWVQIFGLTKSAATSGAGDLDGDMDMDVLSRDGQGRLVIHHGNGAGRWQGPTSAIGTGWVPTDKLVTLGDFTGDGVGDIARIRDGNFELMQGTGAKSFGGPVSLGSGWGGYRHVIGGIDFDNDRRTDVLAVSPGGAVTLYRGNGKGGWNGGTSTVASGWSNATAVLYASDFNGDGFGDVITRRTDGWLWLHPSTGTGKFGSSRPISSGWNGMTALFSPGDFDGSGKPDVLARRADGVAVLYRGNGKGGWVGTTAIATGWNAFNGWG